MGQSVGDYKVAEGEPALARTMFADADHADITGNGQFDLQKLAAVLRTSPEEVAMATGLDEDALQNRTKIQSERVQCRLREMIEVLNRVEQGAGSPLMAYAWYRSVPLPGFDGRTAMQLVQEGDAEQVLDYLDAVDAGIHA